MRINQSSPKMPNNSNLRGKPLEVFVDEKKVQAYEGELVSTVLMEEGISVFQRKLKTGRPAGFYCGMGVCYECLVTIDGVENIRACQTPVRDKMVIKTGSRQTS
jgi:sarcosine oxidase subunit alpha